MNRFYYFMVVFWGKEFRDHFLNLALATALAPNNIPAIQNKAQSKFLICTTEADWQAIQETPLFLTLKTHLEPIWVPFEPPHNDEPKMMAMSRGNKAMTELAFEARAIGVFLSPDLILANNTMTFVDQAIASEKKVILYPALRFEESGCLAGFKKLGLQPGKPFSMTPRDMMSIGLKNLHSESKNWIWNTDRYAPNPITSMWPVPNTLGYVLHTVSWAPLTVDYAAITTHDTSVFEYSTLDHDYIYRNFGTNLEDYTVVHDTDDLMLISLTSEGEFSVPPHPQGQHLAFIGNLIKQNNLRRFYYSATHGIDDLKKALLLKPVFLHAEALTPDWQAVAEKAKHFVKNAIKKPPLSQDPLFNYVIRGLKLFDRISGNFDSTMKQEELEPEGKRSFWRKRNWNGIRKTCVKKAQTIWRLLKEYIKNTLNPETRKEKGFFPVIGYCCAFVAFLLCFGVKKRQQ